MQAAPEHLARLIEAANVTIEFDDPPAPRQVGTGDGAVVLAANVSFDYFLQTQSGYAADWVPKGDEIEVAVSPTFREITIRLEHTMTVPTSYMNAAFWSQSLIKHEFDHVAISADPRPFLLLEHLIRNMGTITTTLDRQTKPSDEELDAIIKEQIVLRRQAVTALIDANNNMLDDSTKHGAQALQDRRAFFGRLYTRSNLAEVGFPYIDAALDMIVSEEYENAERYYDYRPIAAASERPAAAAKATDERK